MGVVLVVVVLLSVLGILRVCNRFHQGNLAVVVVVAVVVVTVVVVVVEVVLVVEEVVLEVVEGSGVELEIRSRQEGFSVEVGIRFHHFLRLFHILH